MHNPRGRQKLRNSNMSGLSEMAMTGGLEEEARNQDTWLGRNVQGLLLTVSRCLADDGTVNMLLQVC